MIFFSRKSLTKLRFFSKNMSFFSVHFRSLTLFQLSVGYVKGILHAIFFRR